MKFLLHFILDREWILNGKNEINMASNCSYFIEVCQPLQKDLGILTINARTGSQRKARKIAKVKGILGAPKNLRWRTGMHLGQVEHTNHTGVLSRYFVHISCMHQHVSWKVLWTRKRKVSEKLGPEPKPSASSTESIPTQGRSSGYQCYYHYYSEFSNV